MEPDDYPGTSTATAEVSASTIDVTALMREVEAEVERKRKNGEYPPELMAAPDDDWDVDQLTPALAKIRHSSIVPMDMRLTSTRPGLGPAVTLVKRSMAWMLRWYTAELRRQSQEFAMQTSHSLDALATRVRDIEGSIVTSWQVDKELDYVAFENRFRGSEAVIEERQSAYVDYFRDGPGRVVDLGCGRGEFLTLLSRAGIEAYGVDQNPGMAAACRARGFEIKADDAIRHLENCQPASLGGVFCAQVLEHLAAPQVIRFFPAAARALKPGGVLIAETLNPQSLVLFAGPLYVDLGHMKPLHPLTLEYLAQAAGFSQVQMRYSSQPPTQASLERLSTDQGEPVDGRTELLNRNIDRLNSIIYGPLDFAVIARL
ncbi:class I SAM-dependent methyltransferase [Candidatus Dormiibacter inghamiae]|uniref:class I SAM-dependent methyltransferase n=1 Tax=Candidatus Dormiibacter inghamiae TaxID=3127013 RepID=UPI0030C74919